MNQHRKEMPHVQSASFIKGITGTDPVTDLSPRRVAFIGRSNVGKSSLQNYLLGRNSLVKSSARPGKTTEINFFDVTLLRDSEKPDIHPINLYFVDLPGYGFARMGEKQRDKLRKLILWYLLETNRENRTVLLVIDAQVGVTEFDQMMIDMMIEQGMRFGIVFNKIDKLNQSQLHQIKHKAVSDFVCPLFFTSCSKKRGGKELWKFILECENPGEKTGK